MFFACTATSQLQSAECDMSTLIRVAEVRRRSSALMMREHY